MSAQHLARLAKAGTLERMLHGVYRVTANPADDRDRTRAAWLSLEPQTPAADRLGRVQPGVLSHRSAAVAHGLGDLDADIIEFTVPARRQTRSPGVRFHVRSLDQSDWTLVDGLPVTTILTTIGDLAAAKLDSGHLAGVVRDALATHHLAFDDVCHVLAPHAHHYSAPFGDGSQLVERLLDEAGVPATTVRLGQYAHHRFRQQGAAALLNTSGLHEPMAPAVLNNPAVVAALQQVSESLHTAAVAPVDVSHPRFPIVLGASLGEAVESLVHRTPAAAERNTSKSEDRTQSQSPRGVS